MEFGGALVAFHFPSTGKCWNEFDARIILATSSSMAMNHRRHPFIIVRIYEPGDYPNVYIFGGPGKIFPRKKNTTAEINAKYLGN